MWTMGASKVDPYLRASSTGSGFCPGALKAKMKISKQCAVNALILGTNNSLTFKQAKEIQILASNFETDLTD
jgi:hypothetical protein